MTEDIDFFVDPAPANVDRLRAALRDLWDDPAIDAIRAEELSGEYPVIRYGPPAKFKSFDDAADALLLREPNAPIAVRMRALFALSARLAPHRPRPV